MSVAETKTEHTVEDLLAMPDDGKSYELVDGQLVEVNVSNLSCLVAAETLARLHNHTKPKDLGPVFGADSYYQCFPNLPRHARKPDVSFIRKERLPVGWLLDQGYFKIAPDLAVEVVSPGDLAYEVDQKILDLNAKVQLVWEINPVERLVFVHRLNGTVAKLKENDQLDGEDVIPGFKCRVGDLFPPRTETQDLAGPYPTSV